MQRYKINGVDIQTRPFPTLLDLQNKWVFGNVHCVINVSERESTEMIQAYADRGIAYYHFPLQENVPDIGWNNVLQATQILLEMIKMHVNTIVHCGFGNHRSPLIVEAAHYAIFEAHYADEYKGYYNHLLYDIKQGYFSLTQAEIENSLKDNFQELVKGLFSPLFVRDLNIKPFSCEFHYIDTDGKPWELYVPLTLTFGEHFVRTDLSDWSNDLNTIRHDMERYVYYRDAEIRLHFEDDPTIIHLRQRHARMDKPIFIDNRQENEQKFTWVEIQPNSFIKQPSFSGFCKDKEPLREIYEALLSAGLYYDYDESKGGDNPWYCPPHEFYNSIKSPIIEDYIRGKGHYGEIQCRQIIIKKAFVISPDVDLQFQSIDAGLTFEKKDELVFYDDEACETEICRMVIHGFEAWWGEFVSAADFADTCMPEDFDMDTWHKRGMELAQQIRDILPDEYDLWYGYPFEDEKNRYKRPRLMYQR